MKTVSWAELAVALDEREALPLTDAGHPRGFTLDEDGVSLYWWRASEPYFIAWHRIRTPVELLHWVAHVSEKRWPKQTPQRISKLIRAVCAHRNWSIG